MMENLRDYQQDMLARLQEAWQRHRSVMVQMPTGTGKTALMTEVIKEFRIKNLEFRSVASRVGIKNCGVLVVAHRRELIEQIREELENSKIQKLENSKIEKLKDSKIQKLKDSKIEKLKDSKIQKLKDSKIEKLKDSKIKELKDGTPFVVVESIQKLSRELSKENSCVPPVASDQRSSASLFTLHFSLIIVDEAHHALAKTYRMLWERWPEAKFLGLTATPCRLSGEPFTDLFDVMLQSWTIQEFIDKGYLSDFEYVSAAPDSMALQQIRMLQKRGADGDYQTKEMVTVMDVPESIEHLYNTYKAFADGKKGIVYAIDRQHAQHIAEYYRAQGVSCAVIDSKTPAEERLQIVEDYRRQTVEDYGLQTVEDYRRQTVEDYRRQTVEDYGRQTIEDYGRQTLDVLVNVDIFSEGFDCPEVEFIQLARPTLSLSKYLQQVGRGMRVSEGKPHVLILDNVGLYQTFGLPTDERDWQQTFLGRQAGKGQQQSRPLVVDMEELVSDKKTGSGGSGSCRQREKELVNLEMVRIKRRGERHEGLEVIVQEGKYGVMYNGTVTCQPRFTRVRPLKNGGEYFALAEFPQGIMGGKTTVISNCGIDLQMSLYGEVTQHGDFFHGKNRKGEPCYWDGIGREYYDRIPTFKNCGGLDLKPFMNGRYRLRRWPNLFVQGVRAEEILANQDIAIIDNVLIVKGRQQRAYTIYCYVSDSVLVRTARENQYLEIRKDGTLGKTVTKVPYNGIRLSPDPNALQLHAVM